jgi:hypothetical protein
LASVTAGTILFFVTQSPATPQTETSWAIDLAPGLSGGYARVRGTF